MLDARNHQGKFGEDYVRALASAAGLLVYQHDLDLDGVDLGFRMPGRTTGVASPCVEAQIKSWSRGEMKQGVSEWHFNGLNEAQFNRIAGDDFTVPRFLFLVRVPSNNMDYVEFTTDGMLLRHLAYYCSLQLETPIEKPDKSRRRPVRVPVANVLTARSLLNLVRSVELAARSTA
ncbi:DUF4365 domain-containing protein [Kibdelosporangium philippinense]|uniref:DUF4365 domain-containing protein n=1 Tax=Kibdelosporangium philippinense TaxID=211113 RepID=A0ABS8Z1F5_9PSEU|nr:DUF4365 domain-containing protein [Kibdelosporangium philippinense]MCE7001771.1 DUF4365 domain-containing protein [Kibdelosporangium philippinense]